MSLTSWHIALIALETGIYRVTLRGTLGENGLAGARMDVVAENGNLRLMESVLFEPDAQGNLVSLIINLEAACTDLEVRVWVSEKSDLAVSMIEIAPWREDCGLGNSESVNIFSSHVDIESGGLRHRRKAESQERTRSVHRMI